MPNSIPHDFPHVYDLVDDLYVLECDQRIIDVRCDNPDDDVCVIILKGRDIIAERKRCLGEEDA